MTPKFFYDFVLGSCLDYVVKLWEKNFQPFFCNTDFKIDAIYGQKLNISQLTN